jgi:hypothetical protein
MDAGPKAGCGLIERVELRKEKVVVQATLTESCIPLSFRAIYMNGVFAAFPSRLPQFRSASTRPQRSYLARLLGPKRMG